MKARILLGAILLYFVCLYWLVENRVRGWLGLKIEHNCFTDAWANFDYDAGDGFMPHKSLSGWFPHVVIVKGARAENRMQLSLTEYVPVKRRPDMKLPPRKFKGIKKTQRFVAL
ncbi:hypothetical protein [Ferribacterium limneticum]|uniref:hypothetical protein n=1 Tax=Ferribacterium limneticum TaxID=76259 RepID=UPI001CF90415|nr:hypothetical protein [Ferribacterium limneticum]UCV26783.1 hypothetical protein KI617_10720 [Ferribacterium limneticum]UCV30700.1 hypothetical protein KI608_10720 [Ferribacterium limneticum]